MEYDVIIVGSRVAGAVTASRLASEGHKVLALDRATFPSDTLSTHFFRAPALRSFERIGVVDQVLAAAPRLAVNYNVVDGIAFPEPVDEPDDFPFYMCVRRITLDDILIRHISSLRNVELHEAARVTSLVEDDGRVVGVTWRNAEGPHESRARVVVGADGVRSFVARQVEPEAEHEEPVNRAMYYAYASGVAPQDGPAAEFHYRGDHLAYCFPCDDELTLLAVSVPIEQFAVFKREPERMFESELAQMEMLGPRLTGSKRVGPVQGTGSIPGYMRVPYGDGWALVGDAAMVMDPWSGQGIDQATSHAVMLAEQLDAYLGGERSWGQAMRAYHEIRTRFSEKTYLRTCRAGRDLRPMTRAALQRRGLL